MSAPYLILLSGCDDHTEFQMDLTPDEVALLERVATASITASEYGCMPTLYIEEAL